MISTGQTDSYLLKQYIYRSKYSVCGRWVKPMDNIGSNPRERINWKLGEILLLPLLTSGFVDGNELKLTSASIGRTSARVLNQQVNSPPKINESTQ